MGLLPYVTPTEIRLTVPVGSRPVMHVQADLPGIKLSPRRTVRSLPLYILLPSLQYEQAFIADHQCAEDYTCKRRTVKIYRPHPIKLPQSANTDDIKVGNLKCQHASCS